MVFGWFSLFPGYIAFTDVDVPAHQADLVSLVTEVENTENGMPGPLPPFVLMFTSYVAQVAAATANPSLIDTSSGSPFVTSDPATYYNLYHQWNNLPEDNPAAAYSNQAFVYADMVQANEFAYESDGLKEIKMGFLPFYQYNVNTDEDIVQSIEDIREVIDNSNLSGKAFPVGDLFTYWQVFMEIDPILWRSLGLVMATIFCCTLLLLGSPLAAFCAVVICAMIVFELYGICMLFLKFNVLIAAGLMASAGISVEFSAHTVAAFAMEEGSVEERLAIAMKHTYMAIILGSVSTLIGVIPLAFHPVPFIVKYQFTPLALAVAIGTFNGMILLPAFLVLAGRLGERLRSCRSKASS